MKVKDDENMDVKIENKFHHSPKRNNRKKEIYGEIKKDGSTIGKVKVIKHKKEPIELDSGQILFINFETSDVNRFVIYPAHFTGHIGFKFDDKSQQPDPIEYGEDNKILIPANRAVGKLIISFFEIPVNDASRLPEVPRRDKCNILASHGNVEIGDEPPCS
jgi:hypothetical protein